MNSVPASIQRVGAFLGRRPSSWQRVSPSSSPTLRWTVQFEDGQSAYIKIANNPQTAQWLRSEYQIHRSFDADFLPKLLGWLEDPRQPTMILENLSTAVWPPPWTSDHVERVLQTLLRVHRSSIAMNRTLLETKRMSEHTWAHVRANPQPFLSLGLCSHDWLQRALLVLERAEAMANLLGNDLMHGDIKSGNVCFVGLRTVFIDWNWACRGNGWVDIAMWLPSLEDEGGPRPEKVLADQAQLAAAVAGNLAVRAPKPAPALYPDLRPMQLRKLRRALPWACRTLGLPIPDRVNPQ